MSQLCSPGRATYEEITLRQTYNIIITLALLNSTDMTHDWLQNVQCQELYKVGLHQYTAHSNISVYMILFFIVFTL